MEATAETIHGVTLQQPVVRAIEQSRRFTFPDIDRHGYWLIPRLRRTYPHLNERQILGWIRGIIGLNEFLFLYNTHGVALAQQINPTLSPTPVIKQHFVWAIDPDNREWVLEVAEFYGDMARWGQRMRLEVAIDLEQNTDVPVELISKHFERVFERRQTVAKIAL